MLQTSLIVLAGASGCRSLLGRFDDSAAQLGVQGAGHRRVPVGIAGQPHKTARAPLGQMMLADHPADGLALDLWG